TRFGGVSRRRAACRAGARARRSGRPRKPPQQDELAEQVDPALEARAGVGVQLSPAELRGPRGARAEVAIPLGWAGSSAGSGARASSAAPWARRASRFAVLAPASWAAEQQELAAMQSPALRPASRRAAPWGAAEELRHLRRVSRARGAAAGQAAGQALLP